jgi:HAMP domain-containing protein
MVNTLQRTTTMLRLPPVIAWTLAAIGAMVLSNVLAREWRRVNAELDARERQSQAVARDELRTLRRDPVSGVYRPE